MVNEGIVLGHKISERGIEVDKAKVDAIEKMPCPTDIKGIRSFLGQAGYYKSLLKTSLRFLGLSPISCKKIFHFFMMIVKKHFKYLRRP